MISTAIVSAVTAFVGGVSYFYYIRRRNSFIDAAFASALDRAREYARTTQTPTDDLLTDALAHVDVVLIQVFDARPLSEKEANRIKVRFSKEVGQ